MVHSAVATEEPRYGLTLSLCDPATVEMAARAGYGFVRIDWEHMMFDSGTVNHMVRIARLLGIPIHVRVSSLINVTALLDLGVDAIMVPKVSNRRVAEEAVQVVKYAQLGERGMNSAARALDFGKTRFADYRKQANEIVKLIVQIEDAEGLENADEIMCLPGVDMVATGKMDISQALGVPGDTANSKVIQAEESVIRKAVHYGKMPIIKATSQQRVKELMAMGVNWFHIGRDESLLNGAIRQLIESLKS